jgi:hypothetical protein
VSVLDEHVSIPFRLLVGAARNREIIMEVSAGGLRGGFDAFD